MMRGDSTAGARPLAASTAAGPSLAARVVKGTAWVFVGKVLSGGMQLTKLVILARLLAPEDFGLFGIVMLAIAVSDTFTQTGFNAALIQRKDNAEQYLDTAWTVQVVRGFVLATSLFAVAPALGWFFKEPRAVPLLRVMCASVVLGGFVNIGVIYFQKELEFHRQVLYDTVSAFVGLLVGIILAYRLRSVWALVWAGVAASAARSVLSYVVHPYRPHLHYSYSQASELFRFGRWVVGTMVVVFLATQLDSAFVGKIVGAAALGLYQIAYRISNAPATEITHLTNAVMMPTYAKLQSDRRRLANAFLQVFELVMTLAIPLSAFIIFAAPQIVLGLLGPQWEAAILPLRILTVAGLLRSMNATGGPLFVGSGHPHMDFWMNLSRAVVIAAAAYPLTRFFGAAGAGVAVLLALASTLPVWASVRGIAGVSWSAILRCMAQGFVLAGLVIVAVLAVGVLGAGMGQLTMLVLQGVAVALLCGVGVAVIGKWFNSGLSVYARNAWRSVRRT